jgi:Family of unknown function (DUF6516)
MAADLIIHLKRLNDDGTVVEVKVWQVPNAVKGSMHQFKYSLFYGRRGERLVGYDNERGKGDHRHYGSVEESYEFRDIRQLLADFEADVARLRGET